MRTYLYIILLLALPCWLYSQNEQVISLANGFALKCKIVSLDSNRVVFTHLQNGITQTDSLKMSEVYKITYPSRRTDANIVFKHKWMVDDKGKIIFTEEDKRTFNMQVKLMQSYTYKSGKNFVIMGGSFFGASLVAGSAGALLFYHNTDIGIATGIGLFSLSGICLVNGITFTGLGATRLKQAKAYQKVVNQIPGEVSLGPAVIKPTNFAMATAYGAGLRLSF